MNDRASRKESVLDAAIRVIARDGIRAVTHRAVAAEAGNSLRATTYHFASIDALIEAAFAHYVQRATERFDAVEAALPDVVSLDEAARALAAVVLGDVEGDRSGLVVEYTLVLEMTRRPSLQPHWEAWQAGLLRTLARWAASLGSPSPALDADLALATLRGIELRALASPNAALDPTHVETLFLRLLRGMAPGSSP